MNAFLKALSLQLENYEALPWDSFPQCLRRSKHEILVGKSCLFDGYFFHVIFGVLRSFRMAPIPPIHSLPLKNASFIQKEIDVLQGWYSSSKGFRLTRQVISSILIVSETFSLCIAYFRRLDDEFWFENHDKDKTKRIPGLFAFDVLIRVFLNIPVRISILSSEPVL